MRAESGPVGAPVTSESQPLDDTVNGGAEATSYRRTGNGTVGASGSGICATASSTLGSTRSAAADVDEVGRRRIGLVRGANHGARGGTRARGATVPLTLPRASMPAAAPDPIAELVHALRRDGRPSLAWVVRWSASGRDPV